jgi:hypothetical protein
VFFFGQNYNGALEQYPQALLFRLGLPHDAFVLRLPQVGWACLGCYLVYRVGLRLLGVPWRAVLAAGLFALGPYFLIWEGVRSRGGYASEMVVVLVAILLALRISGAEHPARWWELGGFGVALGLTYWLNTAAAFVLVPVVLWVSARVARRWRDGLWVLGGIVVGLVPDLCWAVAHGSFPVPNPGVAPSTLHQRLDFVSNPVGREFLGIAYVNGAPGWPVGLGRAVLGLLAVLWLVAAVRHRRTVVALLTLRPTGRDPFDLVLVAAPIVVLGVVASKYAYFTTEPRYLFMAFPLLALALAALVPRAGLRRVGVAVLVVAFVAAPSLTMIVSHADDAPAHRDRDLLRATSVLAADHVRDVYADYWTALPLQFLAGTRLVVGSTTTPERLAAERRAVDRSPDPAWVAARGVNADDVTPMRAALQAAGIRFRERRFGVVSIFDRFSRPVRPWQIGLGVPFPAT